MADEHSETWLGMTIEQSRLLMLQLGAYLVASAGVFKWYDEFKGFYQQQPLLAWIILTVFPLYLLCFSVGPRVWRQYRKARRDAVALTYSPAPARKFFRLDPYVTGAPQEFRRQDDAHNEVLRWIRGTSRPLLFLSGVSGSGKSSVLEGYVLPILSGEGWRVELIRSFDNPLPQLEKALEMRPSGDGRLLIVFDQFEEFVILEERTSVAERRQFSARVHAIRQTPQPGLCLLFSFRRDYMRAVIAMKIDDLISDRNYMEIDAFRRDEARRFLEAAPEKPGPELVDRLLAGAEALDDVPARFRPITLNMLGLALEDFDRQVTERPERLIQGYMETAIEQPEIKEIAPGVVEKMISAANTKEPRTVAELTVETGLSSQEVLVCLVLLARKGLVRPLDAVQSLWEISHDFVARQFGILLGRLRPSVWLQLAMFSAPILFVLILSGVVIGIPFYVHQQGFSALRVLGVAVVEDSKTHEVSAEFPLVADDSTVRSAWPHLLELNVSTILVHGRNVTALPTLPTSLKELDLAITGVTTLPALPTSLEELGLTNTRVTTLPALPSSLRMLDLQNTGVPDNDLAFMASKMRVGG